MYLRRSTVTTYDEGKRKKTAIAEMNRIVEPPVNDRSRWGELFVEEVVA